MKRLLPLAIDCWRLFVESLSQLRFGMLFSLLPSFQPMTPRKGSSADLDVFNRLSRMSSIRCLLVGAGPVLAPTHWNTPGRLTENSGGAVDRPGRARPGRPKPALSLLWLHPTTEPAFQLFFPFTHNQSGPTDWQPARASLLLG